MNGMYSTIFIKGRKVRSYPAAHSPFFYGTPRVAIQKSKTFFRLDFFGWVITKTVGKKFAFYNGRKPIRVE